MNDTYRMEDSVAHFALSLTARRHACDDWGMRAMWVLVAGLIISGCAQSPLSFEATYVDFGVALPGVERTQELALTNNGSSPLVLSSWRSSHPAFSLSFAPRLTLAAGETQYLSVRYVAGDVLSQVEEGNLEVSTEEGAVATVRATGIPSTIDCEVPELVDFGPVPIRTTATRELRFRNDAERKTVAQLGSLTEPYATSLTGPVTVEAGGEVLINLKFTPTSQREFTSLIRVRRHALCADRVVRLIGNGVPQLLTWAETVDFGLTVVGTTDHRFFAISNFSPASVTISDVQLTTNPSFRVVRVPLVVPAAERRDEDLLPGTATLELTFSPATAGTDFAQLGMHTTEPTLPLISTRLSGVGIEKATPPHVDARVVGLRLGASGDDGAAERHLQQPELQAPDALRVSSANRQHPEPLHRFCPVPHRSRGDGRRGKSGRGNRLDRGLVHAGRGWSERWCAHRPDGAALAAVNLREPAWQRRAVAASIN
jgi:hypothetical protein